MRKPIIALAATLLFGTVSKAQIALEHTYTASTELKIINLELSGKKYSVFDKANNQMRLYNMDHSLWKSFSIPVYSGYSADISPVYISERLFNLDNLIECAVQYSYTTPGGCYKVVIINETGAVLDSIPKAFLTSLNVAENNKFKLIVHKCPSADTNFIYSVPGTIPFDSTGHGLGLAKADKKGTGLSDPLPNPSQSTVKLMYTLPAEAKQGVIDLYDANGKKIKSYKVDKTFDYITLDNSSLPAGLYYYNLIADGEISTTKKMVVVK